MVERRMRDGWRLERHLDDRIAERSPPRSATREGWIRKN
jgi:hypothetical protein